jgi:hypothetical protein
MLLLVIILLLLFGGLGGGYYAHTAYGPQGLGGVLGLVLLIGRVRPLHGDQADRRHAQRDRRGRDRRTKPM